MGNYNLNLSFSPEFIDSRVKCNGHFTIISFTPFCKFLCIMKTDGFHPVSRRIDCCCFCNIFIFPDDLHMLHGDASCRKNRFCITFSKWFHVFKFFYKMFCNSSKWQFHIDHYFFCQLFF